MDCSTLTSSSPNRWRCAGISDNDNPLWSNVTFDYPEAEENGPPISDQRAIRFFGPEAFDGELAERYGPSIIAGSGEWPSPEEMNQSQGIILPSTIASEAQASVGDVLESLTFAYVVDESTIFEGTVTDDNCAGEVTVENNEMMYCRMSMTIENLTVMGIYEPWPFGNPTLPFNPIFSTWEVLTEDQRRVLMDNDHMYLGVTIDRGALPTSSTAEAAEWLEALGKAVQDGSYTDEEVELYYTDIISGTITFLNIFLGLIQIFDYIIMIPIVVLSISVLIYGLVLSLEQRRREVSIHRVIGADGQSLQGMVLLELFVMSSVAWLAGYLLALLAVPVVLSAVGFMEFRTGDFDVNPTLSVGATVFTAVTTLGLALLFGRSRARRFIELEIEEGVRKHPRSPNQSVGCTGWPSCSVCWRSPTRGWRPTVTAMALFPTSSSRASSASLDPLRCGSVGRSCSVESERKGRRSCRSSSVARRSSTMSSGV